MSVTEIYDYRIPLLGRLSRAESSWGAVATFQTRLFRFLPKHVYMVAKQLFNRVSLDVAGRNERFRHTSDPAPLAVHRLQFASRPDRFEEFFPLVNSQLVEHGVPRGDAAKGIAQVSPIQIFVRIFSHHARIKRAVIACVAMKAGISEAAGPNDSDHLSKRGGGIENMMQDGVAMHDVELAILERHRSGVSLEDSNVGETPGSELMRESLPVGRVNAKNFPGDCLSRSPDSVRAQHADIRANVQAERDDVQIHGCNFVSERSEKERLNQKRSGPNVEDGFGLRRFARESFHFVAKLVKIAHQAVNARRVAVGAKKVEDFPQSRKTICGCV